MARSESRRAKLATEISVRGTAFFASVGNRRNLAAAPGPVDLVSFCPEPGASARVHRRRSPVLGFESLKRSSYCFPIGLDRKFPS